MQVIREPKIYDLCIVGSGAGGGMAAKVLTEAGAEVARLEAGAMWDAEKDSKMFTWPYESRGSSLAPGWSRYTNLMTLSKRGRSLTLRVWPVS